MEDINSVMNSSTGLSVRHLSSHFAMNCCSYHLFYGKHCHVRRILYRQQAKAASAAGDGSSFE